MQRVAPGQSELHLLEGPRQFLGKRRVEVEAHRLHGPLQALASLHGDGQQVDGVGQVHADRLHAFGHLALEPRLRGQYPDEGKDDQGQDTDAGAGLAEDDVEDAQHATSRTGKDLQRYQLLSPDRRCHPAQHELAVDTLEVIPRRQAGDAPEPAGTQRAHDPA